MSAPGRAAAPLQTAGWLFFLLISLFVTLLPFFWMIYQSCDAAVAAVSANAYRRLFAQASIPTHFVNSVIYAGGLTALSLIFNTLAGFAFACLQFPRRERLFTLLLMTMMIPSQITLVPMFLFLKFFGMLNSFSGLIIPGSAHVFGIFMIRQFLRDLPEEVFEAARIDGCSEWHLFRHIVLPLSRPILATLAVISFIGAWNEFLWPLIVMQKQNMYPLPVALTMLNSQFYDDMGLMMAGAVVTMVPALLIFAFAQRHYIKGLTRGAGK
ncbi:MAG TPA: carbohydrate ABC transporter permease [Candidatus Ozemobacteraceae bacterium]|nr:carbohydrate ABC transporter permease [Candidatus Ozemobacteraceae bacterium]